MPHDSTDSLLSWLIELCAQAKESVALAAPFIKANIAATLIEAIPQDVELTVITRWRPSEIAAKVSDLDVWPILRDRGKSLLLLKQNLHAKYYRGDRVCILGSANLTTAALSGGERGNLELLVRIDSDNQQLHGFEEKLLFGALTVDNHLYRMFCDLVADLEPFQNTITEELTTIEQAENWYPRFRTPWDLFQIYTGSTIHSGEVLEAGKDDLRALAVPAGLGRRGFAAAIAIALRATRLLQSLDTFLGVEERRFGEVRDWMQAWTGDPDSEGRAAQCLIRWLLTFLPDRYQYRRPGYSELLSLRRPHVGS